MSGPPLSFDEQDLLEHVRAALARELPVTEGPYGLSLSGVLEDEHISGTWGGQTGPLLHDSTYVYGNFHFDGLTRQGEPWSIDQAVRLCERSERDHARVTAMIQAFARVARRAMRDAQDDRFGERPWLGLIHLAGAMSTLVDAPAKGARGVEPCEAILVTSRDLREVLAPPAEQLGAAVAALDAWAAAHTALVRTKTFLLEIVHEPSWSPGSKPSPHGVEATRYGLMLTLRTYTFEDDGSIRDIKEQQVYMVPASRFGEMDRVVAWLDGWVAALPRHVAKLSEIETLMPYDFVDSGVLDLKKPRTAEDFEAAFVRRWKLSEA